MALTPDFDLPAGEATVWAMQFTSIMLEALRQVY